MERMMITPFIQGLGASGGLIVAIGAQNAFVLSQGVRGNHHVVVALLCILCDAVFITAGVAGVGATVSANPALAQWVAWGGAGFLFVYGCGSLRSAIRGGTLDTSDRAVLSLSAAVLTTLAVTLLNPHFYLDTVILLGGISSRFHGENRLLFWAGAVSASTLWFICLSLGGQMLAPVFRKQLSWRILDTLVWATMWTIAASLIKHGMPA
jgi:L-lysine exporter family protein LysE/ArgO